MKPMKYHKVLVGTQESWLGHSLSSIMKRGRTPSLIFHVKSKAIFGIAVLAVLDKIVFMYGP